MPAESSITLYLEAWQKRMLKDFAGMRLRDITRVVIKPGKGGCPASYKIPVSGMRKGDWLLYLTDAQMLQVREQLQIRTAIPSVNITQEAIEQGSIAFK